MVVGRDRNGKLGVSGIRKRRVGIRAQKIRGVGDEAAAGEPNVEHALEIQGIVNPDVPDPGERVQKAHKNKLAAGDNVCNPVIDGNFRLL